MAFECPLNSKVKKYCEKKYYRVKKYCMQRNMLSKRVMVFCYDLYKLEVRSDLTDTEIMFGHLVFAPGLHQAISEGIYMAGEQNYYGNLACVICQPRG